MSEHQNKIVGGFRVLREIQVGTGSQGTVYKAVCTDAKDSPVPVGTVVALKVMAVQDESGALWKKLEKRTSELVRMDNPNVVRYYGCFSEQGLFNDVHVVVQEFLQGETLKERLAKHPLGLDVDEALKVADAALSALVYTSGCGIIHRDIKPGNIFLCDDGSVKLIDFEIARQDGGTVTSSVGNIRGSFDYMAPDFIDAGFFGDVKSDVFSMGVVLHEMLTGRTPYQRLEGDGKQANFAFLARWARSLEDGHNPIRVSSRIKRLLAHAEDVMARSLAPRRENRYADFDAFRKGLKAIRFRDLRNGANVYRMLQFVGKGGFGEVFKARLQRTGQLVAVKHLLKADYSERFRREAKIMKKLHDSCFVQFVDFFTMDIGNSREAFLAMAFLDGMPGSSLRDAIKGVRDGKLPARDVFMAFERYARGLQVLHGAGIYHRDIKPSNLYFPAGHPESAAIMDFGIARDASGTATHGLVPGTLDYMPPEVIVANSRGEEGMDIYALGLCFYEALTSRTAFPRLPTGSATYAAFFDRAKARQHPAFDDPDVRADQDLLALLTDMTNPELSQRIRDAGIVRERIRSLLETRFPGAACADDPDVTTAGEGLTMDTVPVQWNDGLKAEIEGELARIRMRRIAKTLAKVCVAIALAAVSWFALVSVRRHFAERESAAASKLQADLALAEKAKARDRDRRLSFDRIAACRAADGKLNEETFMGLREWTLPESVKDDAEIGNRLTDMGLCLAAAVDEKLSVIPPETRRARIRRARELLENPWAEMALPAEVRKRLAKRLAVVSTWSVGVVTNCCGSDIRLDRMTIPAGGVHVAVYEDGHPEKGVIARLGYKAINLPQDLDGKRFEVKESAFVALPVSVTFPAFEKDVKCVFRGKEVIGREVVSLPPGEYECTYGRGEAYEPQKVAFSVRIGVRTTISTPQTWRLTAAAQEREKARVAKAKPPSDAIGEEVGMPAGKNEAKDMAKDLVHTTIDEERQLSEKRNSSHRLGDRMALRLGKDGPFMRFVWCPPGRFQMGSPDSEKGRESGEKRHLVTLTDGFWIGECEVTREQWKFLMPNSSWSFASLLGNDGLYPIDSVSWMDCQEFCRRFSKAVNRVIRLPTEAEWEYACRAGTETEFSFGRVLNGARACCRGASWPYVFAQEGMLPEAKDHSGTVRVGSILPGNPWGIYDMHGNVYEWCSDWYAIYDVSSVTNPVGPKVGSARVIRGGCWNHAAKFCRSACRQRKLPQLKDDMTGFRVCMDDEVAEAPISQADGLQVNKTKTKEK